MLFAAFHLLHLLPQPLSSRNTVSMRRDVMPQPLRLWLPQVLRPARAPPTHPDVIPAPLLASSLAPAPAPGRLRAIADTANGSPQASLLLARMPDCLARLCEAPFPDLSQALGVSSNPTSPRPNLFQDLLQNRPAVARRVFASLALPRQ